MSLNRSESCRAVDRSPCPSSLQARFDEAIARRQRVLCGISRGVSHNRVHPGMLACSLVLSGCGAAALRKSSDLGKAGAVLEGLRNNDDYGLRRGCKFGDREASLFVATQRRVKSRSICLRLGAEGCAPKRVTETAAAALANRTASSRDCSSDSARASAPLNTSRRRSAIPRARCSRRARNVGEIRVPP